MKEFDRQKEKEFYTTKWLVFQKLASVHIYVYKMIQ